MTLRQDPYGNRWLCDHETCRPPGATRPLWPHVESIDEALRAGLAPTLAALTASRDFYRALGAEMDKRAAARDVQRMSAMLRGKVERVPWWRRWWR